MTTNRVSNSGIPNPASTLSPLVTPKTGDAPKASDVKVHAPSAAAAGAGDNGAKAGKNYNVAISTDGKDKAEAFNKALSIARDTPDIREDRVASLKKQIADGSYKVDSGQIADGMLREAIRDHLADNETR